MSRAITLAFCLMVGGCGPAEQPDWITNTGAYGIDTSTPLERRELMEILNKVARQQGHHLDAATDRELAEIYKKTINACVWKGADDDESLACAMDFEERPGLVYLTFTKGTEPGANNRFRSEAVKNLEARFGNLAQIPTMPNGALPLARDLIFDGRDFTVSDEAIERYRLDAKNVPAD